MFLIERVNVFYFWSDWFCFLGAQWLQKRVIEWEIHFLFHELKSSLCYFWFDELVGGKPNWRYCLYEFRWWWVWKYVIVFSSFYGHWASIQTISIGVCRAILPFWRNWKQRITILWLSHSSSYFFYFITSIPLITALKISSRHSSIRPQLG